MRKLALVVAAAAAFGLAAPAFAVENGAPAKTAQTTTIKTVKPNGKTVTKKVAVNRRHHNWRNAYAQSDCKIVKIRKHVGDSVVVKKIRRCV